MRLTILAGLALATACANEHEAKRAACERRVEWMRERIGEAARDDEDPGPIPGWARELRAQIIARHDPTGRAALLGDGVARSLEGCYGIADAFRAAARAPAGERRAAMAQEIPAAVSACQCRGVDVEPLTLFLRMSPAG